MIKKERREAWQEVDTREREREGKRLTNQCTLLEKQTGDICAKKLSCAMRAHPAALRRSRVFILNIEILKKGNVKSEAVRRGGRRVI